MTAENNLVEYKELIDTVQKFFKEKKYNDVIKTCKIIQVMYGDKLEKNKLASLYIHLANSYYALNNIDKYVYYYEEYLKMYPQGQISVFSRLAHAYYYIDTDKSIDYHNKALNIETGKYDIACKLFAMTKSSFYSQLDIREESEHEMSVLKSTIFKNIQKYDFTNKKTLPADKKLNVGYLSSDCFAHTMMNYILPIWKNHDKENFNFYIFSCSDKSDATTDEIKKIGIEFVNCSSCNEEQLAKIINEKDIDILVDIGGYTHLKSLVSLYKPAPIIMSYLGYLNTLGIKEVDYIIADKYSIPEDKAYLYTEKPLYLDTGYQIFSEKKLPEMKELPFKQNGYITYGSFNCSSKFSDVSLYLWAQILKRDKTSKLLIYRTGLTLHIIKSLKQKFEKLGIAEERIIFSNKVYSPHFKAYSLCDISLDTYPFNGMSIAIETALMGVPTITLVGEGIQSRGAGRINNLLGLIDFNANTGEEYINTAIKLAQNKEYLQELHNSLRERVNSSPLKLGADKFTKDLEDKYRKVWIDFINSP